MLKKYIKDRGDPVLLAVDAGLVVFVFCAVLCMCVGTAWFIVKAYLSLAGVPHL